MSHTYRFTYSALQRDVTSGLNYRVRESESPARAQLFLLHGVGSNETHLIGLAECIAPEVEVVLVQGPLAFGPDQFGWFQVRFTAEGPHIDAEQAEQSRRQLISFLHSLAAEAPLPAVIAGFSQGGILSASVGLTQPDTVKGFAVLSGRILPELEPILAPRDALAGLSAFISHGRLDQKLPVSWAERADRWLDELGVIHRTALYPCGHELIAETVSDFNHWLAEPLSLSRPSLGEPA